jgi:hypothetical protein
MKKQAAIKISAVAIFLAFLLINVGTVRCEPPSDHFQEARTKIAKALPRTEGVSRQDLEKEDHERFQLVEWLIRQNLVEQYQRLEINPDLEDNLD